MFIPAPPDREPMTPIAFHGPARRCGASPLMGLARLMRMAFERQDLDPVLTALLDRARASAVDADALMDLSVMMHLLGRKDLGMTAMSRALRTKRLYELPARRGPAIRLLAIMASGDLLTNAPLPFLIEDSDIALSMLYLLPGEAVPADLPAHDVAIIAVSESTSTLPLLRRLADSVQTWARPVLNRPDRIARTSRTNAWHVLEHVPGIHMVASAVVSRDQLRRLASGQADIADLLPDGRLPLIVRPVDSHAGKNLERIDAAAELSTYLQRDVGDEFYVSCFVDYRSKDGQFRKYRIVLVDGIAYPGHMGVSAHWMIHYMNAGMGDSADKRAQEQAFMCGFAAGFGRRHEVALRTLGERFGLDYLVIDCAETVDGELLVFEVDPGAVVHAMDPVDLFPYKCGPMREVFSAFRTMLARSVAAAH